MLVTQRSRLAEEEGISLVEMLVAIMILGLVMGAMATSLTTSLFGVQGQERQVRATALVSEILEQAAGLGWSDVGLCETAAVNHFGGGTYTYDDGTQEDLVTLEDTEAVCQPPSTHPLLPLQTLVRSDVSYALETVVSWKDDPLDGLGAADPDTTEDLKHIWVRARWEHRGEPREHVNATFIAPGALVQEITAEILHDRDEDGTADDDFTYLDAADSLTKSQTSLRVRTIRPQSAVTAEWVLANGNSVGDRAMTALDSTGALWGLVIPKGSPDVIINQLSNGETRFSFKATDAASGVVVTVVKRGLFLIEPIGMSIAWSGGPPAIRVRSDGVACPFSAVVYARGALSSDIATGTWSSPMSTSDGLVAATTDAEGATFERTYTGIGGLGDASSLTLRVDVERVTDLATESRTFDPILLQHLEEGQTC